MPATSRSAAPSPECPEAEAPFYGWRYRKCLRPDGTEELVELLLTLEDVLHPEEGDHIPQNTAHARDCSYLCPILRRASARVRRSVFLHDCIINWGQTGLRGHCPDFGVFRGVLHFPPEPYGTFHLRRCGGVCVLGLEIVSPTTRVNDVTHKLRHYHRAGVRQYVLIDQEREDGPRVVIGYRRMKGRYARMRPDAQGRIPLLALGLLLGVEDGRAVCWDADTSERLGDWAQVERERVAAREEASEATQARERAEAATREQTQARERAEAAVREQTQARERAEAATREQTQARERAEQRALALEAELRRLRERPS